MRTTTITIALLAGLVFATWSTPATAEPSLQCLAAIGSPLIDPWPCFSGTCRFCTPAELGAVDGTEAETVRCTMIVAGSVILSTGDSGVSELVTVNHTLEGDLDCSLRCEDNLGNKSEAALDACRFSQSPKPQPIPNRGLAPAIMLGEE